MSGRRSGAEWLWFPQAGIPRYESGFVDRNSIGVLELERFIPVLAGAPPLVALTQYPEIGVREVEPGGRDIRAFTYSETNPPDVEQVRRRGESQVEINALFQTGRYLAR